MTRRSPTIRVGVPLDPELYCEAKCWADAQGRTVPMAILMLVREAIQSKQPKNRKPKK